MLSLARGNAVELGQIFSGSPWMWKLFGLNVFRGIVNLAITYGCLAPGFFTQDEMALQAGNLVGTVLNWIVALCILLSSYFIVDRNFRVFESIGSSLNFMRGNKFTAFLIYFFVFLIGMIAMLVTCGIGSIFFMPYLILLNAVIYLQATGQATGD